MTGLSPRFVLFFFLSIVLRNLRLNGGDTGFLRVLWCIVHALLLPRISTPRVLSQRVPVPEAFTNSLIFSLF